jgi:hypothetical protein
LLHRSCVMAVAMGNPKVAQAEYRAMYVSVALRRGNLGSWEG